AGAGSALGIGLAYGGVELIRRLAPEHLPRIDELSMDWRVLLFAVGVGIAAALASGLVPALSASRTDLHLALSEGGRGSTEGRGAHRLRDRLVVGEIALALVLSIGAGLLLRSFERVLSSELGFEPEDRLAVQLFAYDDRGEIREDFLQTSQEAILSVPGVEGVAVTTDLPAADDRTISSIEVNVSFTVVDRATPPPGQEPIAAVSSMTPDYPELMGMRVMRGRSFTSLDNADSAPVILVNEALARRHFPGADPVGEALRVEFRDAGPREIVGVLADVRPRGHESDPRPEIYFPLSQVRSGSLTYVVKAGVDPGSLVRPVQEAIWSVEPSQAVWAARPLPDLLWDWMKERSFNTALLSAFALLALALAAIGIYGLMSFTVEQRVGELGIRRAMGAGSADVLRSVLGRGAGLAAVGVGLGLAGSVALSLFLRGMLFAVEPLDPVTYAALPAVVLGVALLASFIPAHRATRVDPATALRVE
ncbi:MAG TPA: FtsX-like permease family protein, partial [Longimicrobiales bacterium]|nr:FtsX-like permease family protein [Longimicrobiales bacterium]